MKMIIVDWEIPPRVRKWLVRLGVPFVVLIGTATVAWASVPHTWSNGDTLSAVDLNGNFSALDARITTLEGASLNQSMFRAHRKAALSVNGNQAVVFDTVDFDLGSEYDVTTGTFTPKTAGYYFVSCNVSFAAPGVSAYWESHINVNGTTWASGGNTSDGHNVREGSRDVVKLAKGDKLTCLEYNEAPPPQPLDVSGAFSNVFEAVRLSP